MSGTTDSGLTNDDHTNACQYINMLEELIQKYEALVPSPPDDIVALKKAAEEQWYKKQAALFPHW